MIHIILNLVQAKHGAERVLQIQFETKSWNGGWAYLAGIEGKLLYNQHVLSEQVRFQSYRIQNSALFVLNNENVDFNGNFEVSLTKEAIDYIEEHRGKSEIIQFTVELQYRWQKILQRDKLTIDQVRDGNVLVGPTVWNETSTHCNVARSSWIEILKRMRYSEIEIFEIQKPKLIEKEIWEECLRYLKDAQDVFRNGDFEGTLTKCRQSLECLSKHYSPDDLKQGFEILLSKVFADDERKRIPINALLLSVSEFSHLGRHANNPPVLISRADAEFIYVSTLNLISFFSQRLAKIDV